MPSSNFPFPPKTEALCMPLCFLEPGPKFHILKIHFAKGSKGDISSRCASSSCAYISSPCCCLAQGYWISLSTEAQDYGGARYPVGRGLTAFQCRTVDHRNLTQKSPFHRPAKYSSPRILWKSFAMPDMAINFVSGVAHFTFRILLYDSEPLVGY
jgi:hypothetical protein